jgi:hypothetical protein
MRRDLAFLFYRNRLNVAISRAQCLAFLVCSPRLLETRCQSIEEMELVNALCRRILDAIQLVRRNDRTGRRQLALGFNIIPILRHTHEREVRFSATHTLSTTKTSMSTLAWRNCFSGA